MGDGLCKTLLWWEDLAGALEALATMVSGLPGSFKGCLLGGAAYVAAGGRVAAANFATRNVGACVVWIGS